MSSWFKAVIPRPHRHFLIWFDISHCFPGVSPLVSGGSCVCMSIAENNQQKEAGVLVIFMRLKICVASEALC